MNIPNAPSARPNTSWLVVEVTLQQIGGPDGRTGIGTSAATKAEADHAA